MANLVKMITIGTRVSFEKAEKQNLNASSYCSSEPDINQKFRRNCRYTPLLYVAHGSKPLSV
jgi:hypothetical protein